MHKQFNSVALGSFVPRQIQTRWGFTEDRHRPHPPPPSCWNPLHMRTLDMQPGCSNRKSWREQKGFLATLHFPAYREHPKNTVQEPLEKLPGPKESLLFNKAFTGTQCLPNSREQLGDSLCTPGAGTLLSITEWQDSLSVCWKLKEGRKMGLNGGVLKACSGKALCYMKMLQSPRR